MTVTVSIAAEAAAKPAEQKDDKDNYKNKSQRHVLSPLLYPNENYLFSMGMPVLQTLFSMPSMPVSELTATDNTPRIDL
jgi:hypothetical protein